MKNMTFRIISKFVVMTALLSFGGGLAYAAKKAPMKPELAAKNEMVRKQQEQRISKEQRATATNGLKAERLRILRAKQLNRKSNPNATDHFQPVTQ